jgi:hypothetical protein
MHKWKVSIRFKMRLKHHYDQTATSKSAGFGKSNQQFLWLYMQQQHISRFYKTPEKRMILKLHSAHTFIMNNPLWKAPDMNFKFYFCPARKAAAWSYLPTIMLFVVLKFSLLFFDFVLMGSKHFDNFLCSLETCAFT